MVIFIASTSACLVHIYLHSQIRFLNLPAISLYTQCDNMGSRSPAEIMFLKEVLVCPAGTPVWQEGGVEDSRAGSKDIRRSVCWICKRIRKGKSEKEACRSYIKCNALLLGFSWPSKGDPLGDRAETSFLLLLSYRTSWHNVASPLEKNLENFSLLLWIKI